MRRLVWAVATVALVLLGLATASLASKPPNHKVTLCHATGSTSNPYVSVTVDVASAGVAAGLHGHRGHSDDIIPSFTYDGVTYPGQGDQSVLARGCEAGQTSTTTTTGTTSTTTSTSTSSTTTTGTTTTTPSVSTSTQTTSTTSPATTGQTTTVASTTSVAATTTPATTTLATSTSSTTTAGSSSGGPVTRRTLREALKKQMRSPGTGRTSGPTRAGELPNTGGPVMPAAGIGVGLLLLGAATRRLGRAT